VRRSARTFGWLGASLAFAGGFALVCAVLTRLVPPVPAGASARADWLREHGAPFDTIFIGSSRTFHQLIPAVFDRAMAEQGVQVRSFNLGTPGMKPPEDAYVIGRALRGREAPLRFLVVECNPIHLDIQPEQRGTTRAVYWHDVPRLRALWQRVWARPALAPEANLGPLAVGNNLVEFSVHLGPWLWNAARVGRGAHLVERALAARDRPGSGKSVVGPLGDGFFPREYREPFHGEELESYRRELAATLDDGDSRLHYGDVASQAEIARKVALAERLGARLVMVAPPILGPVFAPLPESGALFLDFSDPRRFPELFVPEHRNDGGHLNPAGSELYTRLLARRLGSSLAGRS
jgi:hypothetical protein